MSPEALKKRTESGFSFGGLMKFVVPSMIGVGMFLIPIRVGDTITIGFGFLADLLQEVLGESLPLIGVVILTLSVVLTAWAKAGKPRWARVPGLREIFDVNSMWFGMRVIGAVFALMTFFQFGPGFIWDPNIGGVMLNDLVPVLLTFFFFALILLPFLTEFGFMEFIGTLLRKPFRWIFRLPGRSAIDASASWMGSGTVGVLITYQQYERGYYTQREASVIATNFSVVSIAFALLITSFIELNHLFVQLYTTVAVAGLIAAIVVPRLPPLSWKPDVYYEPVGRQIVEESPREGSLLGHSVREGVARAERAPGFRTLVRNTLVNIVDIFFGLIPLVMAIGTVALVLAEYTPVFAWLSYPMVPVLELLRIPEAAAAAPATLVGFADMFLPAVLLTGIESELTRFVIGCLSLTQLLYMSELGAIILKSRIPLSLLELVAIFLIRTVVTLPIIALIAHTLVF